MGGALNTGFHDGQGNNVEALVDPNNGRQIVDNHFQDQTTPPLEYFLTQDLNDVVIVANAGARTKILQLQAGHNVVLDDHIEIYTETPIDTIIDKRFVQLRVVNVNVNEITVQPFIGINIEPANVIFSKRVSEKMNVNGLITPQRFKLGPPNGLKWHMTRAVIVMVCATNPDDGLYGNLPQLTNGVFFGFENDVTENYLVNILANAGYRATAYDVTYTTRSSGGGDYGVSIRKSFNGPDKYGVAIELLGESNDFFVSYINDDLTGLTAHAIKLMGHVVED